MGKPTAIVGVAISREMEIQALVSFEMFYVRFLIADNEDACVLTKSQRIFCTTRSVDHTANNILTNPAIL